MSIIVCTPEPLRSYDVWTVPFSTPAHGISCHGRTARGSGRSSRPRIHVRISGRSLKPDPWVPSQPLPPPPVLGRPLLQRVPSIPIRQHGCSEPSPLRLSSSLIVSAPMPILVPQSCFRQAPCFSAAEGERRKRPENVRDIEFWLHTALVTPFCNIGLQFRSLIERRQNAPTAPTS